MSIRSAFRSQLYFDRNPKRPNWWLRVASYRAEAALEVEFIPFAELDRIRRSQLTAWVLLGLFIGVLGYAPIIVSDTYSAIAFCTFELAIIIAIPLNRTGRVTTAGIIVVSTLMVVTLIGPVGWGLGKGGLLTDLLPDFDYLAGAALLAATMLPPRSVFIVIPVNIILMLLCWNLLPHAPDLLRDQTTYPSQLIAAGTLIGRPIGWTVILGLIVYFVVRGYNLASLRMYMAMSIAEDRTDLAAAMERTAQEQEMIQHYQDIFFTAITRYVADRTQGIINSIVLDFYKPQSALEEHTQLRVAAEATRLNTFFKRLDTQEERRIWDIRQLLSALRNYNYSLSQILQYPAHADLSTIHPKHTIRTNNATIDTMFSLIFAIITGAKSWDLLAHSHLQYTNISQYIEGTRQEALQTYSQSTRGNALSHDSTPPGQFPVSYPGPATPSSTFRQDYPSAGSMRQSSQRLGEEPGNLGRSQQASRAYPEDFSSSPGYINEPNRLSHPTWNSNNQGDFGWPSLEPFQDPAPVPWPQLRQQPYPEPDSYTDSNNVDQQSSWRPPSDPNSQT